MEKLSHIAAVMVIACGFVFGQEPLVLSQEVRDGDERIYGDAFFTLLLKSSELSSLGHDEINKLDNVDANLIKEPVAARAKKFRMSFRVFACLKLTPGSGVEYSGDWPRDKNFWRLDGQIISSGDEPIDAVVFTPINPDKLLRKPKDAAADWAEYPSGRELNVAAIFYKLYQDTDRNGTRRLYPVFIVWQLESPRAGTTLSMLQTIIVIAAAGLLIGAFMYIKRRLKVIKSLSSARPAAR